MQNALLLGAFLSTMEHFLGLTLDEIGSRYKTNNLLLVEHLMAAGLLSDAAPECQEMAMPKKGLRKELLRRDA